MTPLLLQQQQPTLDRVIIDAVTNRRKCMGSPSRDYQNTKHLDLLNRMLRLLNFTDSVDFSDFSDSSDYLKPPSFQDL